jgi:L-fucose isomerase-like protein
LQLYLTALSGMQPRREIFMTFKRAIWYPIAVALSVINVLGVWFAARPTAPWHAATHAALAVAFGLWARGLRHGPREGELRAGLEALEFEVNRLRQELSEAQERLDFAERMLAQGPEARRVDPER